jgi:hypothetical protein
MRKHPWFDGFDWEALKNRKMKPPFMPNTDVANCDTGTNDLNDAFGIEEEKPKIDPKDQVMFKGYDYGAYTENAPPAPARIRYRSPSIIFRDLAEAAPPSPGEIVEVKPAPDASSGSATTM